MNQRISRYFKKPSQLSRFLILFGLAYAVVGIGMAPADSRLNGSIVLGLLITGEGVRRLSRDRKQASDAEVDTWIEQALKTVSDRALIKTGIEKNDLIAAPVCITGFSLEQPPSGMIAGYRGGRDGMLRFTPMKVSVLHFTSDQLLGYTCLLDLTTGNTLKEGTDEFFYSDIVSVSTRTVEKKETVFGTIPIRSLDAFQVLTPGGASINVAVSSSDLTKTLGAKIRTDAVDDAVNAVRKILRAKKGAATKA